MADIQAIPAQQWCVIQTAPGTVETVQRPTPTIEYPTDVVCKVTTSALCGSDLHIYRGHQPPPYGYIMGHEFSGEVVQVGASIKNFKVGDKIVSPFTTSCGECFQCVRECTGRCVKSQLLGTPALPGTQAEYVRVPLADTTLYLAPADIPAHNLCLLADILPTGIFAVNSAWRIMSELEKKDAVCVILGCGPVGSCAIIAACEKFSTVYAIDSVPSRLALAKSYGAIPLNLNEEPIKAVLAATEGRGADAVLEIVGHADALTLAIDLARVGGVVVSSGVHTHNIDMPGRTLYNKNLRFSFGRCPSRVLFPEALELLRKINKTKPELFGDFVEVRAKLSEASKYYALFNEQKVGKVIFTGP